MSKEFVQLISKLMRGNYRFEITKDNNNRYYIYLPNKTFCSYEVSDGKKSLIFARRSNKVCRATTVDEIYNFLQKKYNHKEVEEI